MKKCKLEPSLSLNPNKPKICLLDIDGVVVDHNSPFTPKEGVIDKVNKLVEDGWVIIAFTCRDSMSVYPLVQAGVHIDGYLAKPLASQIMIIDDILVEARNEL